MLESDAGLAQNRDLESIAQSKFTQVGLRVGIPAGCAQNVTRGTGGTFGRQSIFRGLGAEAEQSPGSQGPARGGYHRIELPDIDEDIGRGDHVE